MSVSRTRIAVVALLVLVLVVGLSTASVSAAGAPVRTIVVFDDGVNAPAVARIEKLGAVTVKYLPLVNGVVVWLPSKASQKAIERVAGVKYVETDAVVHAIGKPSKPAPTQPPQTIPWGIDRINADVSRSTISGDPIKVAIVDTGIDTSHPDLAANVKGGMTAVNTSSYKDDNGHGSHVAGIVAAADNTIGVIGVGPGIDLYGVKVLDRRGSGYVSDIIEGLAWCGDNGMQVVNMSLGTSTYTRSFEDAVSALYASGTVIVAAAGNDGIGSAVNYPAAFDDVIAVSATTQSDALAYFTSTGPQIELSAPGYQIFSTYKSGGYSTLSGTSMASPHVAGAAALVMATPVPASDANGVWDPAEVRDRLQTTAEDLGAAGWDSGYGYGLVRADRAIAP